MYGSYHQRNAFWDSFEGKKLSNGKRDLPEWAKPYRDKKQAEKDGSKKEPRENGKK